MPMNELIWEQILRIFGYVGSFIMGIVLELILLFIGGEIKKPESQRNKYVQKKIIIGTLMLGVACGVYFMITEIPVIIGWMTFIITITTMLILGYLVFRPDPQKDPKKHF